MLITLLHGLLYVLLALVVLLAAIGLLLLTVPLRVELRRQLDGPPLRLRLSAGPLRITKRLGTRKKTKAQPSSSKKKKKPRKQSGEKKTASRFDFSQLDWEDTLDLLLQLMDDLMGSITFERLKVTVILHTDDAAKTGNLLGSLSAAVGLLYPELERRFVLNDPQITLDADFNAEKTVWSVDISAMTRVARYPKILWKRRKRLWKVWKTIRRQEVGNGQKGA
jgi:hypothetical protein